MDAQITSRQYDAVITECRNLFEAKTRDYGTAWRVLRPSSLTDQIYIKAQRIRTIEMTGENKVGESARDEFVGIVNYALMALIQLDFVAHGSLEIPLNEALEMYNHQALVTKNLMLKKNHDYGEAWREMRVSSFTDLILMKLLRIKQIEDNRGMTSVSEGIDSGYRDIVNYAVFALIVTPND